MKGKREFWQCPVCRKLKSFKWFRLGRPLCWHRHTIFNGEGMAAMERID